MSETYYIMAKLNEDIHSLLEKNLYVRARNTDEMFNWWGVCEGYGYFKVENDGEKITRVDRDGNPLTTEPKPVFTKETFVIMHKDNDKVEKPGDTYPTYRHAWESLKYYTNKEHLTIRKKVIHYYDIDGTEEKQKLYENALADLKKYYGIE